MSKQQHILVFSDWFTPGYRAGGPIRSLANLIEHMPHRFSVITRITDHHSREAYPGITPNVWMDLNDRVRVMYCTEACIEANHHLKEMHDQYDWIYLNSLFSPAFTIKPLRKARSMKLQNRVILAPRGMLKPGALSIKARKKKWFLRIASWLNWFRGVRWHATNADELKEIQQHFGMDSECVLAPNLAQRYQALASGQPKIRGAMKLVCVARISAEKGILEAIEFLGAAALGPDVSCDFIGTQQDPEYLKRCQETADRLGLSVRFSGEINHHELEHLLPSYHFFYMTTWGENFGHAIAEALQLGLPVLISDRTPWRGLSDAGVGYDLPLQADRFAEVLRQWVGLEDAEYQRMRTRAIAYGLKHVHDDELIAESRRLFSPLIKTTR
ncbi:MAG: glycosyltransferase family 4 protein [Flavobacteriales bacterium]